MAKKPAAKPAPTGRVTVATTVHVMRKMKDPASFAVNGNIAEIDGKSYNASEIMAFVRDGEAYCIVPHVVIEEFTVDTASFTGAGVFASESDDTWGFIGNAFRPVCEDVAEAEDAE